MRAITKPQPGFSLIELVAVITVLSVASIGIAAGFAHLGRSQLLNEDIQAASQMAQACAEHLIASRRNNAYATMLTNCTALGSFNGYGPPTVTTFAPAAGTTCPTGATCNGFLISASYGTNGASAQTRLMVVDY